MVTQPLLSIERCQTGPPSNLLISARKGLKAVSYLDELKKKLLAHIFYPRIAHLYTPLFVLFPGAGEKEEGRRCLQVCCAWTEEKVTLRRPGLWGEMELHQPFVAPGGVCFLYTCHITDCWPTDLISGGAQQFDQWGWVLRCGWSRAWQTRQDRRAGVLLVRVTLFDDTWATPAFEPVSLHVILTFLSLLPFVYFVHTSNLVCNWRASKKV